jgi:hypothetical protein
MRRWNGSARVATSALLASNAAVRNGTRQSNAIPIDGTA